MSQDFNWAAAAGSALVGLAISFCFEGAFSLPFWHNSIPGQEIAGWWSQFWGFTPHAADVSTALAMNSAPAVGTAGTFLDI